MPLLGAIGNASEYSFRGTYDNYPFDIDFGDLVDAEPGQIYITELKLVDGINYKVPLTISGDGEYYIGVETNRQTLTSNSGTSIKNFDSTKITLDQTSTTFDNVIFSGIGYSIQPTFIRNGNTIRLRIFGVPPIILYDNIIVVDRSSIEYNISISNNLTLGLRSGDYTFDPNNSIQVDNRTFQGDEVGSEYYNRTYSTTLTVGKKNFTWSVITKQANAENNLFFGNKNNVDLSTEVVSDIYKIEGLSDPFDYTAEIISNEGLLSVNYGDFVTSSPIKNDDSLRLRLTSSSLYSDQKDATLRIALTSNSTIGSATTTWSVTTLNSN